MKFSVFFLLAVAACFALPATPQTASLSGRATDESGASVPGAVVTLKGRDTRTATARQDGTYSFAALPAGDYTVFATAPELATENAIKVSLSSGAGILDLKLRIIAKAEQVTVSETGAPAVSTDPANNAGAVVIQGKDLEALSDDPDDLQSDLQALAGPAAGPSGGSIFIDGFSGGQLPPKESIREVRINQNPFSPEFDKLGFGRIEIFTKPGADKFKGNVGYNFANDIWNSRNPYASQKAPLLLNEFENSIGGPLNKRSSFTLDLERHMVDNGFIVNGVIVDPSTQQPTAYNAINRTPQRRFHITPRVDYQLNNSNTLTLRYTFIDSEVNGSGIGGSDLISRGYRLHNLFNTVQASDTVAHGNTVNETRFQYYRWNRTTTPTTSAPEIQVLGAFNGGGASVGQGADLQNNYELQNYTSVLHGAHMWRFGTRMRQGVDDNISRTNFNGTYTFQSIAAYMAQTPSQFSITAGTPELTVRQFDIGLFAGDDWRIRPNLTLSYGVRYEAQTNIGDHSNLAPRIGVAWAPGGAQRRRRTVLRAGFGTFYDRFALTNTLAAQRFNGLVQQQYVITSPTFYPEIPSPTMLAGTQSPQVRQAIDGHLHAPYIMQAAFTLERQLTDKTTLSATYTGSRGVHVLRSLDINAPRNGAYPYGTPSPIFLSTSTGIYNQNQWIVNVTARPLSTVSLFGYYVANRAMSDSDGLGTFPANPYNWSGEYGPAATDIRHRVLLGGSLAGKWNIRLSPYITLQSGAPFDLTTGQDIYGTTLFNSRPGIATALRPGVTATPYGLLDPNPVAGEKIVSRNYGRGPGQYNVNLRISKTIGFGREKASASNSNQAPGQINAANMSAPGGMRGLFSPPTSDRRYSLVIGLSGRNLLNHNNPGPIIGTITSPLFGQANQVAGSPNGEGFSENASNRRLELQIKMIW